MIQRERERDAERSRSLADEFTVDTLVLDFDGTLTDIDREAEAFVEGYKLGAVRELNISRSELDVQWKIAVKEIQSNPSKYGWKSNGKIIATATADPLITCRSALELVLIQIGRQPNGEYFAKLADSLFHENYGKMGIAFREGANEFLSATYDLFDGRTYIVTNSSTDKVKAKISRLSPDHSRIQVVGGAKKFVVDDDFNGVPATLSISGLERPVYLRRRHYYETLDKIAVEARTNRGRMAVVGDMWELDLVLPQYLGMAVGQLVRGSTPEFERRTVSSYERGFTANNLNEIYQKLRTIRA